MKLHSQTGEPFIKNYQSSKISELSSQVWCCVQDNRGMTYFGDGSGIIQFDGVSWRRIQNANNSVVRDLALGFDGRIYVACSSDFGFLEPNKKGDMVYISLTKKINEKGINFRDIWKIIVADDGIYFFSDKYIFQYKKIKSLLSFSISLFRMLIM